MSDLGTRIGGLGSNRRIAVALLEVLAEDGDMATRARAVRALGDAAAILDRPDGWIPPERLRAMLTAARFDRRRARRIGQALVRPSALSLALCYTGIASPAKTYRRVHQLLARESEGGRYEAVEVGDQRAHIRFHPAGSDATEPSSSQVWGECGDVLCGLRQGMLASLPDEISQLQNGRLSQAIQYARFRCSMKFRSFKTFGSRKPCSMLAFAAR